MESDNPVAQCMHQFPKPSRFWSLVGVESLITNKETQSGGLKLVFPWDTEGVCRNFRIRAGTEEPR